MSFTVPKKSRSWDWPGSTKAARMIFKLLGVKPFRMKSKSAGELRLLGEIRAGMLEVVAYRNDPDTLGLQMRTSTYQDRGGILLHDCKRIKFIPEGEQQSVVERAVEIICANGETYINEWGIHTTLYPKKEHGAEA